MLRRRASPKLATTIDPDAGAGLVAPGRAERVSDSTSMPAAAWRALEIEDGLAGVAEWEAENGALTEAELAAARERVRSLIARPSP